MFQAWLAPSAKSLAEGDAICVEKVLNECLIQSDTDYTSLSIVEYTLNIFITIS
jgi:hypothetical protein